MTTQTKTLPPKPASAAGPALRPGIAPLTGIGATIKQVTALAVMLIPLVGFVLALQRALAGRMTTTDAVLFGVFYFLHMGGITMGFHRYLAHKTFNTSPFFEGLLLICGSMAAQGPIMFWVTTHRRHHTYSDQHGDPHTPNLHGPGVLGRLRGLWYAHMPWMLARDVSGWNFFAPDILANRKLFFYHRTYGLWILVGLVLPAAIGGAIGGTWDAAYSGFLFGGLARVFLANQAAWCVGSVCHMIGRKPFKTDDNSANNWTVAILTFGEGLQNNHHAFPGSFRHGVKWWEPDLSGWLLAGLGKLGVVWNLRQPDEKTIARMRKRAV
ncbi:acyl-CoA desaturase [Pseudoduganella chitinolytica]|uniref:Acyl-CoA desaturase n=1 Tax=Pseudoduganella chitinolytica TaxID=34070 RepID=A0ABY8B9H2_9BURK|nr:acyl-CoA desaturase [Pseudoduganella chitinolytica]WEF32580.1 acyl-CoA desaturase [Pseudoduganella chitinolytica]